jgi:hypothetical protein
MNKDELNNLQKGVTPSLPERGQGLPAQALAKAGGEAIINRVQSSSLITLDLEQYHTPGDRIFYDLKPLLFQEIILREKDFREALKATDWTAFKGKHVAIGCSADAIVPTWAFMLVAINLQLVAKTVFFGSLAELEIHLFRDVLNKIDWNQYQGAKVVVKGCSKIHVPEAIYVEVAARLKSLASSIMFGEPCSTVPLFKAPKA